MRPSPDLAYSLCAIDLSEGPVRVTTPVPQGYLSLAVYAANTDNVVVVNDRQVEADQLDVVIAKQGDQGPFPAAARLARLPTRRGLVLIRRVIEDPGHFGQVDAERRRTTCRRLRS